MPTAVLSLPNGVLKERVLADRRVLTPLGVGKEGAAADRRVVNPNGVEKERGFADRRVVIPLGVGQEGGVADRRVSCAAGVRKSAPSPTAVLSFPVRVKFPAFRPRNVLWVPNEWRNRAPSTWNCPVRGVVAGSWRFP